jgi:UDP-glucose 4-epimerase
MAKIIVTGGAGFIGSNLVDALIERGDEVTVLDDLSSGKKENVNPKARLAVADIRDYKAILPVFVGSEYVFHLAALPRVPLSIEDPVTTHDVNINGTLNVLLAAREAKVKRLIYSASSSSYGDPEYFPTKETSLPQPLSPYGLQKYVGEHYARLFSLLYSLETVSLRYFNVYGPRASSEGAYALVIAKFLKQRREGSPLTIVPDGSQSRAYSHVSDVVRANILAMESDKVGKGEVINIGGDKDWSVNQIAEMIGGPTVLIEPRIEPRKSLPDTARARKLLGWEPKISLEEGIAGLKKLYNIA